MTNPLSKQGLDAIIGKKINKIPGAYWNKTEYEEVTLITW